MFEKLKNKWKVSFTQLIIILCVFAIGGSLTGYLGKIIMPLFGIEIKLLWLVVYILLVTMIWPMMVLLVSIPFGQFSFFKSYIAKLGRRFHIGK
ncbi:MAG: hypothetical protein IPM48_10595 [Saprospiraceae bacterium]|nr:hypothetical protein [Saprospiraceae bacterium]